MPAHLWGDNVMSRAQFGGGKMSASGLWLLLCEMPEMLQCSPWGCICTSVLLGCALEGTRSPVDMRVARAAICHSGSGWDLWWC